MPDVSLTPVEGNPFGSMSFIPVDDYGRTVDEAATPSPVLSSLASGHAAADYARWVDPTGDYQPGLLSAPALVARAADAIHGAVTDPIGSAAAVGKGVAGSVVSGATLPGDVLMGRVDPTDASVLPRVWDTIGLMGGAGLPMAEEGALGAAGGQGFTVYHGSPHRFDAFDMSKIGTGEGAQAYGHGMYFTDTEAVAQRYRDQLSDWLINGNQPNLNNPNHYASIALAKSNGNPYNALADLELQRDGAGRVNRQTWTPTSRQQDAINDAMRMISRNEKPSNRYKVSTSGHMYEVGVNADPGSFLDYDKPLSGQTPLVSGALADAGLDEGFSSSMPGSELYRSIASGNNLRNSVKTGAPGASRQLLDAGITGIRYLDGMSRSTGQGTSNYVLFNPERDAAIRRIYGTGLPIPGAAPALPAGMQQPATPMFDDLFRREVAAGRAT